MSKAHDIPKTYAEAERLLGERRERNLGNNNRLIRHDNGDITLRYWASDIVTYWPDGHIILTTDGYATVSTHARLNDVARYYARGIFYTHDHEGRVGTRDDAESSDDHALVVFPDGPASLVDVEEWRDIELGMRVSEAGILGGANPDN